MTPLCRTEWSSDSSDAPSPGGLLALAQTTAPAWATVPFTIAGGIAVGAGGAVQRLSGLGFSLVCAPVLVAAATPLEGVRTANCLALFVNIALLVTGDPHLVRWRDVAGLAVPAVVVAVPTAALARRLPDRPLGIVVAVLTLAAVASVARRGPAGRVGPHPWVARWWAAPAVGAASAVSNVLSGIGGPTVAAYGLAAEWEPRVLRVTLQAYFLALNLVSIAALGLPTISATGFGALLGCAGLGVVVGTVIGPRLPPSASRHLVVLLALGGTAVVLVRSLIPR